MITISIPVYRSKGLLVRIVKNILHQTYKNFELIVVSDNDPDRSVDEIRSIKDLRLKIIELDKNVGRYAIDHFVVTQIAKGEYWIPVDSDDWCEKNFLSILIRSLNENTDVVFAAQYKEIGYSKKVEIVKEWDGTDNLKWHAHMAGLWRLDFVLEMNLTNPNFRVGWDSIMTSVPWLVGNVEYIQTPAYHRVSRHNSLTRSKSTGFRSAYRKKVKTYLIKLWKELVQNKDNVEEIKNILLRSRYEQY